MNNAMMLSPKRKPFGTIKSIATGYPSPYISTTMRAVAGRLKINSANDDYVELKNTFVFSSSQDLSFFVNVDESNSLRNTVLQGNDQSTIAFNGNKKLQVVKAGVQTLAFNSIVITPGSNNNFHLYISGGVLYANKNGGTYEGVAISGWSTLGIDTIGYNPFNPNKSLQGTVLKCEFGSSVLEFNETGDNIYVYEN